MNDETDVRLGAEGGRGDLAAQMRRLEAYVADAHSRGEEVPREASLMIARLRELIGALDDLTKSIERH
ncbi:MAG: hypothetical protein ACJ8AO_06630 [Gemmatimonadaceae bacterium]|jgi:hypothetical protein